MPAANSHIATSQHFSPGESIFQSGADGRAWRVIGGSVRLDGVDPSGARSFSNLALAGDIVGSETLLLGTYAFTATALTDCELSPWPESAPEVSRHSLLSSIAHAQLRSAALLALREGQARSRIMGLIRLLAPAATAQQAAVVLPARKDIAEITALRLETVSRIIKGFERAGALLPNRSKGVHAARCFTLNFAAVTD